MTIVLARIVSNIRSSPYILRLLKVRVVHSVSLYVGPAGGVGMHVVCYVMPKKECRLQKDRSKDLLYLQERFQ